MGELIYPNPWNIQIYMINMEKIKIFEIHPHFFRVLVSSPPFVTHHQSQFRLATPRHTG